MSSRSRPNLSIVVTTYEWPEALDVILRALSEQTDPAFEVVVADDGSGPRTANVVNRWRKILGDRVVHAWQPDDGWRKARILDLGALEARGGYLVFMDGDCIPRSGFVDAVRRAALPGWFLSTKRLYLSEGLSRRVLEQQCPIWRWSTAKWMIHERSEVRRPGYLMPLRDRRRPWRPGQADFFPPDNAYGCFLGVSRGDFERVNGWDTRFTGWGCEDVDLTVRLRRIGLRCGWPGPGATVFHLWHPRGTEHPNEPLLFETQESARVEAIEGLSELADELCRQVSAKRVGASSPSSESVNR